MKVWIWTQSPASYSEVSSLLQGCLAAFRCPELPRKLAESQKELSTEYFITQNWERSQTVHELCPQYPAIESPQLQFAASFNLQQLQFAAGLNRINLRIISYKMVFWSVPEILSRQDLMYWSCMKPQQAKYCEIFHAQYNPKAIWQTDLSSIYIQWLIELPINTKAFLNGHTIATITPRISNINWLHWVRRKQKI